MHETGGLTRFRARSSAAPLKRPLRVRLLQLRVRIPRSIERGSIEAPSTTSNNVSEMRFRARLKRIAAIFLVHGVSLVSALDSSARCDVARSDSSDVSLLA